MKNPLKLLAMILAAVLLISTLTSGCGKKGENASPAKKVTLNEVAHSMKYTDKSNI